MTVSLSVNFVRSSVWALQQNRVRPEGKPSEMKLPVRWWESCLRRLGTKSVLICCYCVLLCYINAASPISAASEQTARLGIRDSGPRKSLGVLHPSPLIMYGPGLQSAIVPYTCLLFGRLLYCSRYSERIPSSRILFKKRIQNPNLEFQYVLRCRGGGFEAETLLVAGPLISACHDARDKSQIFKKRQLGSESYSMASRHIYAQPQIMAFPSYPLEDQSNKRQLTGMTWSGENFNLSNLHMNPKQDQLVQNDWSYTNLFRGQNMFAGNMSGNLLRPEPLGETNISMFGRSKSGELIPIEIVELNDDNQSFRMELSDSPISLNSAINQSTDQSQKKELLSEIQNLAKEFPSCAKYLMGELDKRRSDYLIQKIIS